jgi:hypothetical protein
VDPLTKQFPHYTPYQFSGNTPIQAVDLDGAEERHYKLLENSKTGKPYLKLIKEEFVKEYTVFGFKFIFPIHAERADVNYNGTHYYIGYAGSYGTGNQLSIEAFHKWKENPDPAVLAANFYSEGASKNQAAVNAAISAQNTTIMFGELIMPMDLGSSQNAKYFFRGTSEGFKGNRALQITESTPTSSDPGVSTIFAINSKQYGKGILQIALPKDLSGIKIGEANNVMADMEIETVIGLKPEDFTSRVSTTITADQARGILKEIGINLPSQISNADMNAILENTPKLTQPQINQFYKQAAALKQ